MRRADSSSAFCALRQQRNARDPDTFLQQHHKVPRDPAVRQASSAKILHELLYAAVAHVNVPTDERDLAEWNTFGGSFRTLRERDGSHPLAPGIQTRLRFGL